MWRYVLDGQQRLQSFFHHQRGFYDGGVLSSTSTAILILPLIPFNFSLKLIKKPGG